MTPIHSAPVAGRLRRLLLALPLAVLAGCSLFEGEPEGPALPPDLARGANGRTLTAWPTSLDESAVRDRAARLIPSRVRDRAGWAGDLYTAFAHLGIPHAAPTYCAAIAIIEQESSFQADPAVPGLAAIVQRELEERTGRYGIPKLVVSTALLKTSPDGRSYQQRIDALKTEKELNALYEDMTAELPFGKTLLAGHNPVRTGGPMQVSVAFAEQQAKDRGYPYPVERDLRNEVFTRRGGVYFGVAILLDYPVGYDNVVYRFADFNAGRHSSRNAAFQAALGRIADRKLGLDGDLLRYDKGDAALDTSEVEDAALAIRDRLEMTRSQIRRDLLLEKSPAFARSTLYARVFALADKAAGGPVARQAMPRIDLKSPKIRRKLTTEWFARRVEGRYRSCLARDRGAA